MRSSQLISGICLVLFTLVVVSSARADGFGLPSFTVFGTNSVTINDGLNESTVCVTGNVGTGGGTGALSIDKCLVNGNIFVGNASDLTLGSHGAFSGSETIASQAGVGATMSSVSGTLNGLGANLTLSSLAGNMTFTNPSLTGGTYVIDINGNFNLNSNTLTFVAANPADRFVVNISGTFGFSQSIIDLSGFSNADQLIFNVTDACGTADINKSNSIWFGTLLAPNCDVRTHNVNPGAGGSFTGELFGVNTTVDSGAILNGPPTPTPEPGTSALLLLGAGFLGMAGIIRRRSSAE